MKIIVISKNVGRTTPGIVTERLIKGLSQSHELDILTVDYDPSMDLDKVNRVIKYKYREMTKPLSKLFISIFSADPLDLFFAKKAIAQCDNKYDLILSLISSNHYASLMIGNKLAKKITVKHFAHFLDAIPAPGGWLKNDYFFKGLQRFISKNLSQVDGLFSTNQKMLDYQLATFKHRDNLISGVNYNPSSGKMEYYDYCRNGKNSFLFTGGLYGPRKPDYVLGAFKQILKEYPDSTLEFVGSKLPIDCLSIFSSDEREKIIIHPFTKDLTDYYRRATALIDIDSDLPGDVFLSSKIINYLTINRTIISETGDNSPSSELFKGVSSILQCGHSVDELAAAMKEAIQQQGKVNFSDREKVISLFDLNSVINKLNKKISL